MDGFKAILSQIDGGRVLDVATGAGGFASALAECLHSFTEVVGVDMTEKGIATARKTLADDRFEFRVEDATALSFDDGSFDTVAIANSLHHVEHLDGVLAEMMRVLRPGGKFVVFEMYRDGQNEAQMTHVELHHWWAAIDTARGIHHDETYTRAEVVSIVRKLGLRDLRVEDSKDEHAEPLDGAIAERLGSVIDSYMAKAEELSCDATPALAARGEELRSRMLKVGFQGATHVIAVGTK
ncbi:class I SAM-dependent methyltransferase [bacterium]|nr:class I SAM-dependent methyltransferase [bacterium]